MILFIKLFDLQVPDNDIPKNILNKLHGIQTPKTFYLINTNDFMGKNSNSFAKTNMQVSNSLKIKFH